MEFKALSLYRQSLRILRDLPVPAVRSKMIYNIRELFEIYKDAPAHKIEEVLQDGHRDISLLKEILKGRKDTVFNLFKTFENLNEPETTEPEILSDSSKQILPL